MQLEKLNKQGTMPIRNSEINRYAPPTN